jgi:hypothetical protein
MRAQSVDDVLEWNRERHAILNALFGDYFFLPSVARDPIVLKKLVVSIFHLLVKYVESKN